MHLRLQYEVFSTTSCGGKSCSTSRDSISSKARTLAGSSRCRVSDVTVDTGPLPSAEDGGEPVEVGLGAIEGGRPSLRRLDLLEVPAHPRLDRRVEHGRGEGKQHRVLLVDMGAQQVNVVTGGLRASGPRPLGHGPDQGAAFRVLVEHHAHGASCGRNARLRERREEMLLFLRVVVPIREDPEPRETVAPPSLMMPAAERAPPETSRRRPSNTRCLTVIWFSVMVPVLSVQITVVDPSVSTADSRRTSAP